MFTIPNRQRLRQGRYGTSRRQYLQDLVTQFQNAKTDEMKVQIVAHLGNFAYDPYNYQHFRELNILELFLDCLTERNEQLIEFALAGICNCSPDLENAAMIVSNGGIPMVISCLSSPVEHTVLSAIVSLYYLCSPSTEKDIVTSSVLNCMRSYSESHNTRLSNAAKAFLDMYGK